MVYDVAIIGGGASGLFCSLFLPKEMKKCIIEKNDRPAIKVLLSGGERCNVTNIDLDPASHYVGEMLKSLPSLFHRYGPQDIISYLSDHGIETRIENNGRVILKSGRAKELADFLIDASKNNGTEFFLSYEVNDITISQDSLFTVSTPVGSFSARNVIVASGGMTYPQVGASPFAYEIAERLGLSISTPHAALCGIVTKEDISSLAGNTVQATLTLYRDDKVAYSAKGPLLFTHHGASGPIVFNATLFIDDISRCSLQSDFDLSGTSKKVIQYFKLIPGDTIRDLPLKALRPIQEAKVTAGGILLKELDQSFQSKKIPGLYIIGEALDVTGYTGGFNLQWAWTSAYVCAKHIRILL